MNTSIRIGAAIGLGIAIAIGLHLRTSAPAPATAPSAAITPTAASLPARPMARDDDASPAPATRLSRAEMARLIAEQTAIQTEREVRQRQRLETAANASALP